MSKIAIKVENVSKLYRLGEISTGTISHDLNRWWAKFRGKDDPYAKIGTTNDRASKGESDYAWVLKDLNFEIQKGDAVGIIGKNGAGKSTLLKLLSRVSAPTNGVIKVNGRIASLLEVGTGFHPELTGRENVFLNGAILGMSKAEIARKFDEIVAFAGVERYIDTPVKRYSSGMYVRLAFGVAAHLESEILIVDEVLAVGDIEFQKKCLGKMSDVTNNEGRTVLFVSHNMAAVMGLCNKAILLKNGMLESSGSSNEIVNSYLKGGLENADKKKWINKNKLNNQEIYFKSVSINSDENGIILMGQTIRFEAIVEAQNDVNHIQISCRLFNEEGLLLTCTNTGDKGVEYKFEKGEHKVTFEMTPLNLLEGDYTVSFSLIENYGRVIYHQLDEFLSFTIVTSDVFGSGVPLLRDRGIFWTEPIISLS